MRGGEETRGTTAYFVAVLLTSAMNPAPNTDERAGSDDDEGQLPALDEAHAEAAYEGGEALDEDAHLVRDGLVDSC